MPTDPIHTATTPRTTQRTRSAGLVLAVNFTLSFLYEAYRSTAKAGTSRHDSLHGLVEQLPLYATAALVIWLLLTRRRHAASIGLAFCAAVIGISILYYNPVIMLERDPATIDWIEDLVFTGLLFAAATQLIEELAVTRRARGPRGVHLPAGDEPERTYALSR